MFRTWPLSKRFALVSGPVLVGAGVLIGVVNHSWFLDSIESAAERNNVALARVLSNVVWPKFEADVLARTDSSAWRADLNREVASLIRHSSIVKVKLYLADGSVAYSTDPGATGEDEEGEAHNAAAAEHAGESGEAGHSEGGDGEAAHTEGGEGEAGHSDGAEDEAGHGEAGGGEAGHSEGSEGGAGHGEAGHGESGVEEAGHSDGAEGEAGHGEAGHSGGGEGGAGHDEAGGGEAGHGEGGEGGYNDGFATAINGEVISEIEFEPRINIFNRVITDRHTVSSYIPIFDTDDHRKPVAVFEIYDDITGLLAEFRASEIRTGMFLGSVLLLMYVSLVMMVMRSELVARRNQEARVRMANAAARADAASTAKSEFLANMSHELRTPLNAIVGFSEVMKDGLLGPVTPRPYAEYVRHIWVAASHLTDIIGNILDLSKIDAGKVTVENSRVALPETILLVCGMMHDKASKRGIALTQDIEPGIDTIVTDAVKLRQILLNLLSNAIKFTGEGGQVMLRIGRVADGLEFSIRDTGIGMDEAGIRIAMSPFGQIESPFSRMHEGTGLGLPLTLRLVNLIGGRMEISSEKGVGTLVTVTLPVGELAVPTLKQDINPQPKARARAS
ncbi:MAG TPA: ATP-binding protein [Dongiaceae bacterium]|nr:ATP-binding protein [Dongiaceae bacterium]